MSRRWAPSGVGHGNTEYALCPAQGAAWRYLTEQRGIAPGQIVFFGRSLGGGPTVQLATETTPAAVIIESTFLSIPEAAQDMIRWLPVRKYVRTQFNNASKLPRVTAPILIVHSPDDRLIPYRHGQGLFDRANQPKQFLEIRGDHNEGFVLSGEIHRKGLSDFLTPLFPANQYTATSPMKQVPTEN